MCHHTTVQPYKVLLLTCVVNCTVGTPMPQLCSVVQWSVHWAPSQTTWVLVLAGTRRWDVQEKKMRALLLGLAKSIYYITVEVKIMVRSIKWHTAKAESVFCDPLQSRSMAAWNLFVYEDKESKKLLMLMSSMYLSSYRSWLRINHNACTI